jgi:hypothetical protein
MRPASQMFAKTPVDYFTKLVHSRGLEPPHLFGYMQLKLTWLLRFGCVDPPASSERMPALAAAYRLFKPRIINDFQAAKCLVTSKTMLSRIGSSLQVIEKMEREMGFEPTASSLGKWMSIVNK